MVYHESEVLMATAPLCVLPLLIVAIILLAVIFIRPRSETPTKSRSSSLIKASPPYDKPPSSPRISLLQQQSRLLSLPAELRQQIWLYAIPPTMAFSKQIPNPHAPSLMFTTRQTFAETLPIFMFNTRFILNIHEVEGAYIYDVIRKLRGLANRAGPSPKSKVTVNYHFSGRLRWSSLLRWAESLHSDRDMTAPPALGIRNEAGLVVESTLFIASKLRPLKWKDAKEVLEALPAAKNPRWM